MRDAALAAIVVGLLYVPFLNHGRIPIGSLGTYVQRFRFNDPVFATLERVAAPQLVAGLAVLVGFLTAIWMRRKSAEGSSDAFAWPMQHRFSARRCISMVPAVGAAVHKVELNGADHGLDFEHYSHLLCLASAHRWTAVVSS